MMILARERDATIHLNRLQNSSSFQVAPKGIWPSATSYVTTTLPDTIVMLFELRCPVDFFCGDPVSYCFVSRYAFWSWLKNMTPFAMSCCNFLGTLSTLKVLIKVSWFCYNYWWSHWPCFQMKQTQSICDMITYH